MQELCKPASVRVEQSIETVFPQSTEIWTTLRPIDKVVYCVNCVVSLASVGTPVCDRSDYIRLTFQHTEDDIKSLEYALILQGGAPPVVQATVGYGRLLAYILDF